MNIPRRLALVLFASVGVASIGVGGVLWLTSRVPKGAGGRVLPAPASARVGLRPLPGGGLAELVQSF